MAQSMKTVGRLCGVTVVLLLATLCFASANDTSLNLTVNPPQPLGDDAVPVRMLAEHITINFGREKTRVEVEFTFENLADYEHSCWAGFPDEDLLYRYIWSGYDQSSSDTASTDDLAYKYNLGELVYSDTAGNIENFKAWTRPGGAPASANVELPWQTVRIESLATTLPTPDTPPALNAPWSAFDLNRLLLCRAFELHFQPHEQIIVGHSYEAATGGNVNGQRLFQYQLVTGRNWRGTIGEAVVDVILEPDLAGEGLYFKDYTEDWGPPVTRPDKDVLKRAGPGRYHLVWRDFEPEGDTGWIFLATPQHLPELEDETGTQDNG